jgi:hypothetical protein
MSDENKKVYVFLETYFYTPLSSFMEESLYCIPYQKIKLPDIKNIETKIHLGFVYSDRDEVKNSFTRKDLP